MNHFWLAYDALIVMVGVVMLALLAAVRSRRVFLGPFALFYAAFTASLLIALSRGYVTLNVAAPSALSIFLFYGLGSVFSCVSLFFAVLFGHRALGLRRPLLLRGVAVALAAASVLTLSPLGVRFEPDMASYRLLPGYLVAASIHLTVFAHVMSLAIRAARLRHDRYDTLFFRGMLVFAAIGFVESAAGLATSWAHPVGSLDAEAEEFLYSSIPYLLFSLFLGFYLWRLLHEPRREQDMEARASLDLGLSAREQDVLELVLDGLNNKRIAAELDISVATVKTHLYNIFRKAGVGSRFELARRVEQGQGRSQG